MNFFSHICLQRSSTIIRKQRLGTYTVSNYADINYLENTHSFYLKDTVFFYKFVSIARKNVGAQQLGHSSPAFLVWILSNDKKSQRYSGKRSPLYVQPAFQNQCSTQQQVYQSTSAVFWEPLKEENSSNTLELMVGFNSNWIFCKETRKQIFTS